MSRSQIACAFSADKTTIVRLKSSGTPAYTMTMCQTIDGGMDDLTGLKGTRLARKLVSILDEWKGESVTLTFSPPEILTLPAYFSPETSAERLESLYRIEAGFFLREVDAWRWSAMAMQQEPGAPETPERHILMFYPAAPARFIETELGRHFDMQPGGVHINAISSLSTGQTEALPVLELEERYTAFTVSENGKSSYFRYWPVTKEEDRSYFAITELTSAPTGMEPVRVTGSAASAKTLDRIRKESSCILQPLELQPWIRETKGSGKNRSMSATMRAASAAIKAINSAKA